MTHSDRRLVIHVGPHKPASTYIQENLRATQQQLLKAGWLFPDHPTDPRAGQHAIASSLAEYVPEDAPGHSVLTEWASQARSHSHSMVLSAETFCRRDVTTISEMARVLGFDSYEMVYVIRDPLDVFPSIWAEEV